MFDKSDFMPSAFFSNVDRALFWILKTGMMPIRNMRILTVVPVASAPEDGVILKIPEDVPLVAKWLPSKPANGVSKKIAFTWATWPFRLNGVI
jgi:hypothetical protein